MTAKERYEKAGFDIEVEKQVKDMYWLLISGQYFMSFPSEAEAWQWVEDNFPLPHVSKMETTDIETIKKKWQKRLDSKSWDGYEAINAVKEFLSDLGEK